MHLTLNLRFARIGAAAAAMPPLAPGLRVARALASPAGPARAHPVAALPLLQLALQLLHLPVQLGVGVLLLLETFAQLDIFALQLLDAGTSVHDQKVPITNGELCLPN